MTSILIKNSIFKQHLLHLTFIILTIIILTRCTENRASESLDKNPPRSLNIDIIQVGDNEKCYSITYRRGEFLVYKKHKNYKENCAYLKSHNYIKTTYPSGIENFEVFVKSPIGDVIPVPGPKPCPEPFINDLPKVQPGIILNNNTNN